MAGVLDLSSKFPSVGIGNGGTWSGGLAQWYLFSEADANVVECNAGEGNREGGNKDKDEDVDSGTEGGKYMELEVDGGGTARDGKVGSKAGAKVGGFGGGNGGGVGRVGKVGGKAGVKVGGIGGGKLDKAGWDEVIGAVWRCVLYKDDSK